MSADLLIVKKKKIASRSARRSKQSWLMWSPSERTLSLSWGYFLGAYSGRREDGQR